MGDTKLHGNVVFGPVKSRRLGTSLGINLSPYDRKICSFDCIYCECGFNDASRATRSRFPSKETVYELLQTILQEMSDTGESLDSITFSGNGEPTLHPDFEQIIDDVIKLRDRFFPQAKISVLSNATRIKRESVFRALNRVDNNILKLDGGSEELIRLIDRPTNASFNLPDLVKNLKRFQGNLIIQTIFFRGTYQGQTIDCTTEENVSRWLDLLKEIKPKQVMLYSLDRATPVTTLEKVGRNELEEIGNRVSQLGIAVTIA